MIDRNNPEIDEHGGHKSYETNTDGRNVEHFPAMGCSHCPAAFFDQNSHQNHMIDRHSDKPTAEVWQSSPDHVVEYHPNLTRNHPNFYLLKDRKSNRFLSNMVTDHDGEVTGLETHPKMRRQGLAAELWHAAQQHAETTPGVPTPYHSRQRTRAGDAWAKKVGGEVPPVPKQGLMSARQMRGMIDFNRE